MESSAVADRLPFAREADVAANREARISGRQMLGLLYSGLGRIILGLPIAGVAAAIAWTPDVTAMVTGIASFGLGLYISWRGFSFLGDAITRKVTYVTGPIGMTTRYSKGTTYYYLNVGPAHTRISKETSRTLPTGLKCHAYYAPGSLQLLSLEPATEAEPHPTLRFGGDSAHAWDRLRWPLVVAAVAALGLVTGNHAVTVAHPAQTFPQSGVMSDYQEKGGRGSYRHLFLQGSSQVYSLDPLDNYSPAIPYLGPYVGDKVDLYISSDAEGKVLALRLRETLHASDYYLHPEHQQGDMISLGATVAVLSGITVIVALWWQFLARMRQKVAPPLPNAKELTDVEKRAHEAMRN